MLFALVVHKLIANIESKSKLEIESIHKVSLRESIIVLTILDCFK